MTYGDIDNVTIDAGALTDIIARQGTDILLEVLAEHVGKAANNFGLSQAEVQRVVDLNIRKYREWVSERT